MARRPGTTITSSSTRLPLPSTRSKALALAFFTVAYNLVEGGVAMLGAALSDILIAVFLSWQFVVGEYLGGILLILCTWLIARLIPGLPATARAGIHWFYSRPPIINITFEMDTRGVRQELFLNLKR